MSPMRAVALVIALVFTAVKIAVFACELAAGQTLVGTSLQSIGNVVIHVAWVAFWALYVEERLRQHSANRAQDVLDAIAAAVEESCNRSATDARLDLMRRLNPDHGHISGHANGHGGTRPTLVT